MTLETFVTERLVAFRDRTGMWGSNEAVELQAIQLIELEVQSYAERALLKNPRIALEAYVKELGARYPGEGARPLHELAGEAEFGEALFDVCSATRRGLRYALLPSERPRSTPGFLSKALVDRAIENVRQDTHGDWLRDPWDWPELSNNSGMEAAARDVLVQRRDPWTVNIDVPKSRFETRPAVVLSPEFRVAYQLCVDHLSWELLRDLDRRVYGWRLARSDASLGHYADNGDEWSLHRQQRGEFGEQFKYVLRADVREFFASIRPETVLAGLTPSDGARAHLEGLLTRFDAASGRRGLPQRCLASSLLAHAALRPVDRALSCRRDVVWCRWMDDYEVYSNSHSTLVNVLRGIEHRLRDVGLSLNAAKTAILETAEGLPEIDTGGVDLAPGQFSPDVETSGLVGPGYRLRKNAINIPRLRAITDDALGSAKSMPRSVVGFLARRLRLVGDVDRARQLAQISDNLPHCADRLARLFREMGIAHERVDWYVEYARKHACSTDWTTVAWSTMFDSRSDADAVLEFFRDALSKRWSPALTPLAAYRVAQWAPTSNDVLHDVIVNSSDPFEVRGALLAFARLGPVDTALKDRAKQMGLKLTDVAVAASAAGATGWDFQR